MYIINAVKKNTILAKLRHYTEPSLQHFARWYNFFIFF